VYFRRCCPSQVEHLCATFAVDEEGALGMGRKTVELVPGGADETVTAENRVRYATARFK